MDGGIRNSSKFVPDKITSELNGEISDEVNKVIDSINDKFKSLKSEMSNMDNSSLQKMITNLDTINSKLQQTKQSFANNLDFSNILNDLDAFKSKMNEINNSVSSNNSGQQLSNEMQNIANNTKEVINIINQFKDGLNIMGNEAEKDTEKLRKTIEIMSALGGSIKDVNKNKLESLTSQNFTTEMDYLSNQIGNALESIKRFDKETVSLSNNLNSTTREIQNIFNQLETSTIGLSSSFGTKIQESLDNVQNKLLKLQASWDPANVNFTNPDQSIISNHQEFYKSMFKTFEENKKAINDMFSKMMNNNNQFLPEHMLNEMKFIDVMKNAQSSIDPLYNNAENVIGQMMKKVKENENPNNKEFLSLLKNELEEIQTLKNQTYNSFSQMQAGGINSRINNIVNNSSGQYAKQKELELANMAYGNLTNSMSYGFRQARGSANQARGIMYEMNSPNGKYDQYDKDNINDFINLNESIKKLETVEKLGSVFNAEKRKAMKDIDEALAGGDKNKINAAINNFNALLKLVQQISQQTIDFKEEGIINFDHNLFKKMDNDVKSFVNTLSQFSSGNVDMINEVKTMVEKLESADQGFEKLVDEKTLDRLDEAGNKIRNINQQLESTQTGSGGLRSMASDFFSPMSGARKLASGFGMGAIPLSLGALANYGTGIITGPYMQQGQLLSQGIQSEYGMGNQIDMTGNRYRIFQQGMKYHEMSNGLIGLPEYQNSYTGLMRNVGGQYGLNDTQSINDLNTINDETFLFNKLYNISDSTYQKSVKTFYKEHEMGAKETADAIKMLGNVALTTNIPMEKYVNTVSDLAMQYKDLGLTGGNAINIMDNLLGQGLSLPQAQGFASSAGGAVNNFAQNTGQMGFFGMLSGQFSNPWSAIRHGIDRFDSSGNVRENYGSTVSKAMDSMLRTYQGLGGENEDLQYKLVYDQLKKMGFSSSQADIGVDMWLEGDGGFEEWLTETNPGEQVVVLKGQEELEGTMRDIADALSPLQAMNEDLAREQWRIAGHFEDSLDEIMGTTRGSINTLINSINNIAVPLSNLVGNIVKSPVGKAAGNFAIDHPFITGGALLGGRMLMKPVGRTIAKKAKGIFGSTDDVGKALASGSDEMAGLLAKGGDEVTGLLAKGGKYGLIAGGVLAGAYGLSKIFGGRSNTTETAALNDPVAKSIKTIEKNVVQMGSGTSQSQIQQDNFYNPVHSYDGYTPTSPSVNYGMGGVYSGSNNIIAGGLADYYNTPIDDTMTAAGLATGGAFAMKGTQKLVSKFGGIRHIDNAGLSSKLFKTTVGEATESTLSKVAPGIIADVIFNSTSAMKHSIKGDSVSEDYSSAGINTGIDILLALLGGGTPLSIMLPMLAETTGIKSKITESIVGMSENEIEYKRAILNDPKAIGSQQFQMMGFEKQSADLMSEALREHSNKIKSVTDTATEQLAWLRKYVELRSSGKDDAGAASGASVSFNNDKSKNEETNKTKEMMKNALKNSGYSYDDDTINQFIKNGISNASDMNEIIKTMDGSKRKRMNEIINKNKINFGLDDYSAEDIINAYNNPNSLIHNSASKLFKDVDVIGSAEHYARKSATNEAGNFATEYEDNTNFINNKINDILGFGTNARKNMFNNYIRNYQKTHGRVPNRYEVSAYERNIKEGFRSGDEGIVNKIIQQNIGDEDTVNNIIDSYSQMSKLRPELFQIGKIINPNAQWNADNENVNSYVNSIVQSNKGNTNLETFMNLADEFQGANIEDLAGVNGDNGLISYMAGKAGILNDGKILSNKQILSDKYSSAISKDEIAKGDIVYNEKLNYDSNISGSFDKSGKKSYQMGVIDEHGNVAYVDEKTGKTMTKPYSSSDWYRGRRLKERPSGVEDKTPEEQESLLQKVSQSSPMAMGEMLYNIDRSTGEFGIFDYDSDTQTNWAKIAKDIVKKGGYTGGMGFNTQSMAAKIGHLIDEGDIDGARNEYAKTVAESSSMSSDRAKQIHLKLTSDDKELEELIKEGVITVLKEHGYKIEQIEESLVQLGFDVTENNKNNFYNDRT